MIKKNIHWIITLLALGVLVVHIFILREVMRFDWEIAIQDGCISATLLCLSVWSIVLLIRAYPTTAALFVYSLFIATLTGFVTTFIEIEALKEWVVKDNTVYKVWLTRTIPIRFIIILLFNGWMATTAALRKNLSGLETRFQQQADASVLLKEAELFKLRQQLQPHFLYNSLNSISALMMISPDKAQDMLGKLSDFLRSSVKRESEETLSIKEELNYIQSYLDIESVRFGDRLQVHFELEHAESAFLPPFLLQPILENAIKFGLYGKTGTVDIVIHTSMEGNMLEITITNPYDPDVQPPRGTGFGLEGINRRLFLIYARTDLLETHKDQQNFTTILKIPQLHVQSNADRR